MREVFGAGVKDSHAAQRQFLHGLLEELHLLSRRLDQRYLKVWARDLERQSGYAGARPDVDDRGGDEPGLLQGVKQRRRLW